MSDIVKDSTTLKQALLDRWEEIGISHVMVAKDAIKIGIKGVTTNAISKWIGDSYKAGALNQEQIVKLCYRYGIPAKLVVGVPYMYKEGSETKIKYIIEQPFNEEEALKNLYEMFPDLKKPRKKKKNG